MVQGCTNHEHVTRTNELEPENNTLAAKPRKYAWDILTDTEQGFGLPVERESQQRRVGKLTADITSTLEHHGIDVDDQEQALRLAALSWPQHFPDATLTPDAFAKHLPALLRPPLRRSRAEAEAEAECTHRWEDGRNAVCADTDRCDICMAVQPTPLELVEAVG